MCPARAEELEWQCVLLEQESWNVRQQGSWNTVCPGVGMAMCPARAVGVTVRPARAGELSSSVSC